MAESPTAAAWAAAAGAAQASALAAAQATGSATPAGGKPLPVVLVVAVALLDGQGRVLLAQRPPGKKLAGLWEFPGGKVDAGESPEAALVRELAEELGIEVAPGALTPLAFASHAYDSFHLLMPTYGCAHWNGEPTGCEGQAVAWVTAEQLLKGAYAMPPADEPLLPAVLAVMRAHRAAATERAASLGVPGGWEI
ncbi:NTP pyrophosphohydrolase [Micractinium conductrix]|uniref:8-oxo-dGTP diphosphatase n=1 Tax=Micractinium conductrix TaxID=554055 RepID=A0A2P6V5F4_9CHLO|nr:NTP pyrophosphohydrolase [Micractinium conductrix]|eukprot:PSC69316.1 NTP pyrophosphohydrolase [Micractinium conductrix]